MKHRKLRVIYLVVCLAAVALFALAAGLISLGQSRRYRADADKKLAAAERSVSAILDRAEMVSILMGQEDWTATYAQNSPEELAGLSPLEKAKRYAALRVFNSIVGMYCEIGILFGEPGYALYSEGFSPTEVYGSFYYDKEGAPLDIYEAFLGRGGTVFEGGIQLYYLGSLTPVVVYVRPSSYTPSVRFVFALGEEMFAEAESAAADTEGRLSLLFEGKPVYGSGVGKFWTTLDNYGLTLGYDAPFRVWGLILWLGVAAAATVSAAAVALYFARRITESIQIKVRTLNRILKRKEEGGGKLIALMDEAAAALKERERSMTALLKKSGGGIVEAYLMMLMDGRLAWDENMRSVLDLLGVDGDAPLRVAAFKNPPAFREGILIDGTVLVTSGQTDFGAVCGISSVKSDFGGVREAYAEAKTALAYAALKDRRDVMWETLPAFQPLGFDGEKFVQKVEGLAAARQFDACDNLIKNVFDDLKASDYVPQEVTGFFRKLDGMLVELTGGLGQSAPPVGFYRLESEETYRLRLTEALGRIIVLNAQKPENRAYNHFAAVKSYIDQNIACPDLSLKTIAAHFGYSTSYISRLFSENGDFHYLQYIGLKRVELSKELIRQGKSVQTVAAECGFDNAVTFRKTFKKLTGCAPNDYKSLVSKTE